VTRGAISASLRLLEPHNETDIRAHSARIPTLKAWQDIVNAPVLRAQVVPRSSTVASLLRYVKNAAPSLKVLSIMRDDYPEIIESLMTDAKLKSKHETVLLHYFRPDIEADTLRQERMALQCT
jgi:anionic cell wall polymer biosynthesis LytR-Cps2A-Psr (LCP) family protein